MKTVTEYKADAQARGLDMLRRLLSPNTTVFVTCHSYEMGKDTARGRFTLCYSPGANQVNGITTYVAEALDLELVDAKYLVFESEKYQLGNALVVEISKAIFAGEESQLCCANL